MPSAAFNASRPVIVVLGAGRSGTSLLMQVLAALGMRVSPALIGAREDNPEGFYEDAGIVRIQADLMRALGAWPYHPLPANWLDAPATAAAEIALRALLRERLGEAGGVWGFKDPRTASFLPLWQRIFSAEAIAPRYLLALREPDDILRSFMRAYQASAPLAESVWLRRTCDALWHTQAACHVVHYEDWFIRGDGVAAGLARFCGLDTAADTRMPGGLVRPELNRCGGPRVDTALASPRARALQAALRACRGDIRERAQLLQRVADCRAALDAPASPA
ncbi:MAG: sulfotransferase [Betaproteobacteria bacterium]|nr:sulfotransferase [Betaproteobacteria bacterium]